MKSTLSPVRYSLKEFEKTFKNRRRIRCTLVIETGLIEYPEVSCERLLEKAKKHKGAYVVVYGRGLCPPMKHEEIKCLRTR